MACIFFVHFRLELSNLFGCLIGEFFVFFFKFSQLFRLDGELFFSFLKLLREFVGVGPFFSEQGFEILDVFAEFLDCIFELLNKFFIFLVFFLEDVLFSFHFDKIAFKIDDLLGFVKLGLDGSFLLLHEVVDKGLKLFVFGLFLFEEREMFEFELFFRVKHEFGFGYFFKQLFFISLEIVNFIL